MASQIGRRNTSCISRSVLFFILAVHWAGNLISSCSARDCHTSFRRAWRDLNCQEQDEFLSAIKTVKDSGAYDEFIDVHLSVERLTHGPAEFLPWHRYVLKPEGTANEQTNFESEPVLTLLLFDFHLLPLMTFFYRWFIYNFEKMLQQTTGKCIYIPYWDWERDAEFERESDVMHQATFGGWGDRDNRLCATTGITVEHEAFESSPAVNNRGEGCVTREFRNGFSFTGESQILAQISNYDQYADTTGNRDPRPRPGTTNGFRHELENGGHRLVHVIVGGHMATNWSPADPLFYLHHANIDRLWSMWQDYWDHDTVDVADYTSPWHFDSERGLDETLPYSQAERISSWDFRMQHQDRDPEYPTVREVMNNDGDVMSVRYQNSYLNNLMPDYEPNPRWFQPARDTVPVKCDRDSFEEAKRRRDLENEQKPQLEEVLERLTAFRTKLDTTHSRIRNFFRTSLHGNDADEIEDNLEPFVRPPVKNPLASNGMDIRAGSADTEDVTMDYCGRPPLFTLQQDRDEWDRLCQELPANTTIPERLALMAESDCNRRGNPRSDDPALTMDMSMTAFMDPDAPLASFECFHRPDPVLS